MTARRAATLALFAVLGVAVAAPAASVAPGTAGAPVAGSFEGAAAANVQGVAASNVQGTAASNASLGTQMAAFVTAGVETAGESVEREMWQAAYERRDNRSARADLVDRRTATIEERIAAVEAEKRDLVRQRRRGEVEPVVFRARMSALAARLAALRRSINHTAPRAAAVGADPAAVRSLRERARNASGPELRQARSLGGGPPDGTLPGGPPGGPPGGGPGAETPGPDAGPPGGQGPNPQGPATGTPTPADCPGPSDDPGSAPDDPANATGDTGPPDC